MHQQPNRTSIARLVLVTLVVLLLGACSDTGSSTPTPASTNLPGRARPPGLPSWPPQRPDHQPLSLRGPPGPGRGQDRLPDHHPHPTRPGPHPPAGRRQADRHELQPQRTTAQQPPRASTWSSRVRRRRPRPPSTRGSPPKPPSPSSHERPVCQRWPCLNALAAPGGGRPVASFRVARTRRGIRGGALERRPAWGGCGSTGRPSPDRGAR